VKPVTTSNTTGHQFEEKKQKFISIKDAVKKHANFGMTFAGNLPSSIKNSVQLDKIKAEHLGSLPQRRESAIGVKVSEFAQ